MECVTIKFLSIGIDYSIGAVTTKRYSKSRIFLYCKIFDGQAQVSVVINGDTVIFARPTVQFDNESYLSYHVKNNCGTLIAIIC